MTQRYRPDKRKGKASPALCFFMYENNVKNNPTLMTILSVRKRLKLAVLNVS